MTLLTADDVLTVKFEVSSFKEGYKQDEVDVFLDDVTTTMREFEERLGTSQESSGPSHRKAEILLTAEGVRNIRFSTTRWSGYRIDQVDAFLAQVVSTMEALEYQSPGDCPSADGTWPRPALPCPRGSRPEASWRPYCSGPSAPGSAPERLPGPGSSLRERSGR